MATAQLEYRYAAPSVLRGRADGSDLLLATCGGVTEAGPATHPYFFSAFLTEPGPAALGMLACAAVARSRYYLASSTLAILRDPVVTSSEDRLRFESFSSCGGVHARLDLLPGALADAPITSGTTNVDFNAAMRAALGGAAIRGPLLLSVGSDELIVDTLGGSVTERKVPLPDRWLKGFGEVQAIARRMHLLGELTGAAAQRFVRSIPRQAKRPLWAVPGPGGFSLQASRRGQAACLAGPHRLVELAPMLRFARKLRVYGPDLEAGATEAPSAWELDLGSARFTLTLSPEKYRGFSGEGALLELLGDEDAAVDSLLVAESLGWGSRVDSGRLSVALDLGPRRVAAALGYLAACGRVGYDLAEESFFHRELPFGRALDALHPRLGNARQLIETGAVTLNASGAIVVGTDSEHRVTFGGSAGPDRCTCPWWGKHRGNRGPCKHVLAARMAVTR
ncbi:MAG TPA: SWIM zinc finger family protein [Streptosporangiaceae bacterium]|nr:SWIM zinc finger family protein [Streptosporangiaceae bacterium]